MFAFLGKLFDSKAVKQTTMNLPSNFIWMSEDRIGTWPKMIKEAVPFLGMKEIKGTKSEPRLMEVAKEIGVADIYKNDDTSWCAVIHNGIAKRAGKSIGYKKDKFDLLRALKFQEYGVGLFPDDWEVLHKKEAMFGDTMIFLRPGGGHVGFYIGENDTHYYIMGGNQNDMYSFTRLAKYRLVAVRRPKYKTTPPSVKKYILTDNGVPVTTNEA